MSCICCLQAAVMGMVRAVTPHNSISRSELVLVWAEVPKPGMVMAMMSLAGQPSFWYASNVTSSANVLSRPPEMPITDFFSPVFFSRS